MAFMNDTKFLGLCILLAALMISASIIWSTKANVDAMAATASVNGVAAPASAATSATTVTISGPVTLAPFASPIPVTIATTNGAPLTVKEVSDKQWTR
jgi:hypothetical protein